MYVPESVVFEAEKIMSETNIKTRSDAFEEMAKYSRVGREVDKIGRLDLLWGDFFSKRRRKDGS